MSLRRRILLGFLLVAAVLVGTNLLLAGTVHSFLLDRLDRQLVEAVDPLSHQPFARGDRGRGPGGPPPEQEQEGEETFTEYFVAVGYVDSDTFRSYSSALDREDLPPPELNRRKLFEHLAEEREPLRPYTAPAESGDGSWRLVAQLDRDGRVTVVGTSLDELEATRDRIRLLQTTGTGAVLVALGLASWWMLRLGVHPVEGMAQTADAIAAGDLSRRVEHPDVRTEAGRLGAAFNAMLARIEDAFRAREASEARLRRFAADASHELRTPLTTIRGYAELYRAGGLRGEAELDDAMRRMEQEAHRMGGLVEDLLLLARLDQRRPLEQSAVRLDQLAADAVRDARAVEPDRPIEVATRPVVVPGDEMRLRQVVGNLLANARVHTPAGTPVAVSVEAGAGDGAGAGEGMARLVVSDAGPGMEPDVAAKVFERFYRADASRARARAAGGTGLGLSIVAAIAEAHGGRATVDSEVGRGSRFVVELPLRAPDGAAPSEGGDGDGDGPPGAPGPGSGDGPPEVLADAGEGTWVMPAGTATDEDDPAGLAPTGDPDEPPSPAPTPRTPSTP
ncbi:MAG: ATP-binding protein [Acidimicrobiales bacterium]